MSESAQLFEVDSRLDGENHPRLEHGIIASIEKWRFVSLEADRVADVMADRVLHAELARQLDARQLDLARRDPGRHDIDRARLQREHCVECALLLPCGVAHDHRSFELAVIPVDVGAGATDQHVTRLDPVAHHKTMRHGG